MKRFYRLSLFALIVSLFIGQAIILTRHFSNVIYEQRLKDWLEVRKAQIVIVMNSFHSYYHVWPCPPGQLNQDAETELGGFATATINTQHINFFEKNQVDIALSDFNGNYYYFKPDDSIGTCSIYEKPQ